ncbi:MAG: hypothetical protein ACM3O3_12820 [Syntrophothermus sp.]
MATDITAIRDTLKTNVKNQRTPVVITDDEYLEFAIAGCKRLYIDTGVVANWDSEYTSGATPTLSSTLNLNQIQYCITSAEIEFFNSIITYWNTMVSYVTNALTISNAFKPYEFIAKLIEVRENKLIQLFHRMTDTANASSITDITIDNVDYTFDD